MGKSYLFYKLSIEADHDLEEIFDYTAQHYGFNQAVTYLLALKNTFNRLLENPNICRERVEIKDEIFSIVEKEHIIFYSIQKDSIFIVRVLHGRRDIPNFLK